MPYVFSHLRFLVPNVSYEYKTWNNLRNKKSRKQEKTMGVFGREIAGYRSYEVGNRIMGRSLQLERWE